MACCQRCRQSTCEWLSMQEVDTLSEAFLGIRSVLSQPTEEVLLEKDFSMPEKSGLFWRGRLRFVSALEEKHFAVITHNSFAPWQPNYPRLPAANALMGPTQVLLRRQASRNRLHSVASQRSMWKLFAAWPSVNRVIAVNFLHHCRTGSTSFRFLDHTPASPASARRSVSDRRCHVLGYRAQDLFNDSLGGGYGTRADRGQNPCFSSR